MKGRQLGTGAWIRLMKAYNLVLREARDSLNGQCTLSQFDMLALLVREPKGMTPADLSRCLLVTAGNITGLVDRMERMDWVKRVPDSGDRRVSRVQLTETGAAVAGKLIPRHITDIERLFTVLHPPEKTRLRQLLDKLIRGIEKKHEPAGKL